VSRERGALRRRGAKEGKADRDRLGMATMAGDDLDGDCGRGDHRRRLGKRCQRGEYQPGDDDRDDAEDRNDLTST
jgi:hypothetical protein